MHCIKAGGGGGDTGPGMLLPDGRTLCPGWAHVKVVGLACVPLLREEGQAMCFSPGAGVKPGAPLTFMAGQANNSAHRGIRAA